MASASSTSARNLFQDSKRRLSERVQVNVNNLGSIVHQVQRGSKSNEMIQQSAKHFCQTESTMENSFNNLQKMQVLLAQMSHQQQTVKASIHQVEDVHEQIRDMQR